MTSLSFFLHQTLYSSFVIPLLLMVLQYMLLLLMTFLTTSPNLSVLLFLSINKLLNSIPFIKPSHMLPLSTNFSVLFLTLSLPSMPQFLLNLVPTHPSEPKFSNFLPHLFLYSQNLLFLQLQTLSTPPTHLSLKPTFYCKNNSLFSLDPNFLHTYIFQCFMQILLWQSQ
jgi:hypothetical protein